MIYLDDRIEFTISLPTDKPAGIYRYNIYTYSAHLQGESLVFSGNFYYDTTAKHIFDVTDIIRSLDDVVSRTYLTNTTAYTGRDQQLIAKYKVKAYLGDVTYDSGWSYIAMCYRYPNYRNTNDFSNGDNVFFDPTSTEGLSKLRPALQGLTGNTLDLIPRYPLVDTNNYKFVQSYLFGSRIKSCYLFIYGENYHNDITINASQSEEGTLISIPINDYYFIDWSGSHFVSDIYVEDENSSVIAIFEHCYSRYYLFWQDRFGGFQSQPFNDYISYSENINTTETISYTDARKKSFLSIQPKWKLSSGWIKESVLPLYESIYVSPVIYLYDTQEDKRYEVILKDNFVEKTYKDEKKLLSLTLELEAVTAQNIIY